MATGKSVSDVSIIVWEWMSEFRRWKAYEPELVLYIEQHYGKTSRINPGVVQSSLSKYIIDFNKMCQIRQGTGNSYPVRRVNSHIISINGNQIVWQFSGDSSGNWVMYDFDVGKYLETLYINGQNFVDLRTSPFKLPYYINLSAMEQIRIETGKIRLIRRHTLQIPYPLSENVQTNLTVAQKNPVNMSSKRRPADSNDLGCSKKMKKDLSKSAVSVPSGSGGLSPLDLLSPKNSNMSLFTSTQSSSSPQSPSFVPSGFQQPLTGRLYNSFVSGPVPQLLQKSQNVFLHQNSSTNYQVNQTLQMLPNRLNNLQISSHNNFQTLMPTSQVLHNPGPSLSNSFFIPQSSVQGGIPNSYLSYVSQSSMTNVGLNGISNGPVQIFSSPSSSFPPEESFHCNGRIVLGKRSKKKSKTAEEVLKKFVKNVPHPKPDENCCICYDTLLEESSYGDENKYSNEERVISFKKCDHTFHRQCVYAMYNSGPKDDSIQCPSCKMIYGERYGNCPPGEMEFHVIPNSLPGYPDHHTIRISYNIRPGIQGPEHPNPGHQYNARAFPRVAFLPNNDQGRKVLQLLIIAWKRRLMFTVGTSTTTGESETVTWNEIHHKTEFGTNASGHGYPDPNYLDNVTLELAVHGVTEDDL